MKKSNKAPWDEFPKDLSTWNCAVSEYKELEIENELLKTKLERAIEVITFYGGTVDEDKDEQI